MQVRCFWIELVEDAPQQGGHAEFVDQAHVDAVHPPVASARVRRDRPTSRRKRDVSMGDGDEGPFR